MKYQANWMTAGLLSLLAAGCCTLNEPGAPCRSDSATIMAAPGQLHIKPECLTVAAGESLTLRLRVADSVRAVSTRPGAGFAFASWLSGSAERGGAIVLTAPSEKNTGDACTDRECEYKFEILVDGVGMLDPRVRVRYASP